MNKKIDHFNRIQAIKYLKKAFLSIDPESDKDLPADTLMAASIANSIVYLADQIAEIKMHIYEEDIDKDEILVGQ